jgi:hypothetical protein
MRRNQEPMVNPAVPPIASDDQVREMLIRYRCPVPFHAVRTRFLGNIASPRVEASPIKVVEDLWGGQLPPFESLGAVNELIGALVMGLWNGLARHQERSAPFRLTRIDVSTTQERLGILALTRREELDGESPIGCKCQIRSSSLVQMAGEGTRKWTE